MAARSEDLNVGTELCPRCCVRAQEDDATGFCSRCAGERAAEEYLLKEAADVVARRRSWQKRTARPERTDAAPATRERQRRSRMLRAIRPREPAPPSADPYVLGAEAVQHLTRVRMVLARMKLLGVLEDVDRATELVRQLAYGPGP